MMRMWYHSNSKSLVKIITKFIRKRATPKMDANTVLHLEIANSPIINGLLANFMVGIRANGSWMLYRMLSQVSMPVRVPTSRKRTQRAGTIATALVKKTLCQTGSLKSRNPSITN